MPLHATNSQKSRSAGSQQPFVGISGSASDVLSAEESLSKQQLQKDRDGDALGSWEKSQVIIGTCFNFSDSSKVTVL